MRLLRKHGVIIDVEDNKGRTPLQLALKYKSHNIVTCLTEGEERNIHRVSHVFYGYLVYRLHTVRGRGKTLY